MREQRQAYVRPFVMKLDCATDVKVSQICSCKFEQSMSGSEAIGCKLSSNPNVPCSECVS